MDLIMPADPIPAILDQLTACREQLSQLEAREAAHHQAVTAQLTELAHPGQPQAENPDGYQPGPQPAWWKLPADQRQELVARLRAWVEQVYQPGYGHLSAALGPCWSAHDLCLYGLDTLSELWSVLYLQPSRTPGLLSAQAEYQARILPALAAQLQAETTSCGHTTATSPRWSTP